MASPSWLFGTKAVARATAAHADSLHQLDLGPALQQRLSRREREQLARAPSKGSWPPRPATTHRSPRADPRARARDPRLGAGRGSRRQGYAGWLSMEPFDYRPGQHWPGCAAQSIGHARAARPCRACYKSAPTRPKAMRPSTRRRLRLTGDTESAASSRQVRRPGPPCCSCTALRELRAHVSEVIPELSQAAYVIAPDPPGFGESDVLQSPSFPAFRQSRSC